MTRVSKNFVELQVSLEMNNAFKWLIAKLNNRQTIESFCQDFLTKEEQIMLSKRLFIGYLIKKGLGYREISTLLKVSTATVDKAREWLDRRSGYKQIVLMLVKRQKEIDFDKKLNAILKRLFPRSRADWSRLQGLSDFPEKY